MARAHACSGCPLFLELDAFGRRSVSTNPTKVGRLSHLALQTLVLYEVRSTQEEVVCQSVVDVRVTS